MRDDDETKIINSRYNDLLNRHGISPKAVGWPKLRHDLRFKIFSETFGLKGHSILDFGCGYGLLFDYLKRSKVDVRYTGVDINSRFIKLAREKYPDGQFICGNFLKNPPQKTFDFVLCSGVHNIRMKDNDAFLRDSISLFWGLSAKGCAVNFLSDHVQYRSSESNHSGPYEVMKEAYKYTNRIVLRNDYMPFEFTLFVWKEGDFDQDTVVYRDCK